MSQVFSSEGLEGVWVPTGRSIVDCLSDPLMQGRYIDSNSAHFATNFGLSSYTGIAHIVDSNLSPNPENLGWRLPALTDQKVVFHMPRTLLLPYVLKLMDGGKYYRFEGTFEDCIAELKAGNYEFVEPPSDTLEFLRWLRVKEEELGQERIGNVTYEFAARVAEARKPRWKQSIDEPYILSIRAWLKEAFCHDVKLAGK